MSVLVPNSGLECLGLESEFILFVLSLLEVLALLLALLPKNVELLAESVVLEFDAVDLLLLDYALLPDLLDLQLEVFVLLGATLQLGGVVLLEQFGLLAPVELTLLHQTVLLLLSALLLVETLVTIIQFFELAG